MDDAARLEAARWMERTDRRWPLVAVAMLGSLIALHATLAWHGRILALQRLEESRRSLIASAPDAIPADDNAWTVWREAEAALPHSFGGRHADEIDLASIARDPSGTLAPAGPLRSYVRGSAAAIERMYRAAAMPRVRWTDPVDQTDEGRHFLVIRNSFKALHAATLVAAADGNWPDVHAHLLAMSGALAQLRTAPDQTSVQFARGLQTRQRMAIRDAVSQGPVPDSDLRQLETLVHAPDFGDPVICAEANSRSAMQLAHWCDRLGAGLVPNGSVTLREHGQWQQPPDLPPELSWYALAYQFDRPFLARAMDRIHAVTAGSASAPPMPALLTRPFAMLLPATRAYLGAVSVVNRTPVPVHARMAAFAIGCRRYHARSGRWPLEPAEVTVDESDRMDPHADPPAPFLLRLHEDAMLEIRSVGRNARVDRETDPVKDDVHVRMRP